MGLAARLSEPACGAERGGHGIGHVSQSCAGHCRSAEPARAVAHPGVRKPDTDSAEPRAARALLSVAARCLGPRGARFWLGLLGAWVSAVAARACVVFDASR